MLLRTFFLLLAFTLAQLVYAEETLLENKFSGSIALGGYNTSGNTQTKTFDGELELGHSYGDWSSEFSFKATQVSDANVVTSDYYEGTFKSIYNLPANFYTFFQLGYREDTFGGIYFEKSQIAGFGYHAFANQSNYKLDIELGYGERVTKKLIAGVIRDKLDYDPGTHIAIIGQYDFSEDDAVKLKMSGEFGNDDDYIKKDISWVHTLFDEFNFDLGYESRTLSKPGVGKVATDEKYSVKLGYKF